MQMKRKIADHVENYVDTVMLTPLLLTTMLTVGRSGAGRPASATGVRWRCGPIAPQPMNPIGLDTVVDTLPPAAKGATALPFSPRNGEGGPSFAHRRPLLNGRRRAHQAVREAIGSAVPVLANGGVEYPSDLPAILAATGCDGVMVAEAALESPVRSAPCTAPLHSTCRWSAPCTAPCTRHAVGLPPALPPCTRHAVGGFICVCVRVCASVRSTPHSS